MGEERIQGLTLDLVLQTLVHGCMQMNVKHQTLLTHILMMQMTNVRKVSSDLFFDKQNDEIQHEVPVGIN